ELGAPARGGQRNGWVPRLRAAARRGAGHAAVVRGPQLDPHDHRLVLPELGRAGGWQAMSRYQVDKVIREVAHDEAAQAAFLADPAAYLEGRDLTNEERAALLA